jgi:hypothetical protein
MYLGCEPKVLLRILQTPIYAHLLESGCLQDQKALSNRPTSRLKYFGGCCFGDGYVALGCGVQHKQASWWGVPQDLFILLHAGLADSCTAAAVAVVLQVFAHSGGACE